MIEDSAMPTEELPAIAIVGMAGRFPQAGDVDEFWSHLCAGQECLSRFSAAELRIAGVAQTTLNDSRYVPVNGVLRDIELFDAGFFGMTPREASITDPQHRVFLELAWDALEHCGHDPATFPGTIGVYSGCGMSSYLLGNLWSNRADLADVGDLRIRMGNSQEYLATRVSYKLNLTGPSVSINTACSTSLVAVHMACEALLSFQCDMALSGGISIQVPQIKGYRYEEEGILSPDGHCRAFDADARGTVSGNGGAIVVLKRLADALADRDTIYAVIRGSAINNDGADKAGFTAPSVVGQARVIAEAQSIAGIDPDTVGYIEAHGTGTPLGDPIEFTGLTRVFRRQTNRTQFCALGSVKSNVGHLDEAAGVTGLIKAALSLYHRKITPSLHFERPNAEIDYLSSPFYVNTELRDWPTPDGGYKRRAGVSSFGIGGTNAHLLLEEAPAPARSSWTRTVQLLPYSASTTTALDERGKNLAAWIASHPELDLADVAYTLQVGRREFASRRYVVGAGADEVRASLNSPRLAQLAPSVGDPPPVVFMFSGQGSQYPGMARSLYEQEPVFRHWIDTAAELLVPLLGRDLRHLLYPVLADGEHKAVPELQRTDLAQPALFVLEYSLAQLWMHWGIRPQAMIGHSIGEYVCACLSGVLELDAALAMVTLRGRLMQSAPAGAMLSVPLDPDSLKHYLKNDIEIAALNAPDRCVVAGSTASIIDLKERLDVEGIEAHRLNVSHAFHSHSMAPILDDFNKALGQHKWRSAQVPYVSNVTGDWIRPDEAGDPLYYVRHLRQPVRFAAGLSSLLKAHPDAVFVEVGPGHALTQLARRCVPDDNLCVPSLPQAGNSDCHRVLFTAVGQLWEHGVAVDWTAFAEAGRRRVGLPGYPFQRQRHWIEARPESEARAIAEPVVKSSSPDAKDMLDRWCYVPRWQSTPATPSTPPTGHWLLLTSHDANDLFAETLRNAGCRVTVVQAGEGFARLGPGRYSLRPQSREDYLALLEDLPEPPSQIVWLWSYGPAPGWRAEDWCFALLSVFQALDSQPSQTRLSVVASGLAAIAPGEGSQLSVEKGTLPGLLRSAGLEFPELAIRLIDLMPAALKDELNVSGLIGLCQDESNESFVAWRTNQRWVPRYQAVRSSGAQGLRLRRGGVYLITGGLGGIGLTLANDLARNWEARLVLLGRTPLPLESDWDHILADSSAPPATRLTVQGLQALRDSSAEMLIEHGDVTDRNQLSQVIARARAHFGSVNGVIHAAGVADGVLLARQTREGMNEVLGAKVTGTRLLQELLIDEPLDFCLLCSGLSGVTGAPGQSAYCAANSFLDHFSHAATASWPLLTIDWDAWREVGMAVNSSRKPDANDRGVPVRHPLLQTRAVTSDGRTIYKANLSEAEHWVLSEHRVGKKALLPGTAYLEMACAAVRDNCGATALEVQDFYLLQPLLLDADEVSHLEIVLSPQGEQYAFQISSRAFDQSTELHAEGRITPMPALPLVVADAPRAEMSVANGNSNADDITLRQRLARFGPRWQCLKQLGGRNREFADLSLDDDYTAETDDYLLHPALLDVATGFPVLDKHYDSALLPFAYRRVRLYGPLPGKLRSELRGVRERDDGLHLDLRLLDQEGRVLAEIEDYHLRKTSRAMSGEPLAEKLPPGLSCADGVAVFHHALSLGQPQLVIANEEPMQIIKRLRGLNLFDVTSVSPGVNDRPQMDTPYAAPRGETEMRLAPILEKLLGLKGIGRDDDFFALSGDSLIGTRYIAEINRELGIRLTLRDLFEGPTISALAAKAVEPAKSLAPKISPAPQSSDYPLTHAQRRLWILAQNPSASVAYNMCYSLSLNGDLDLTALRKAFGLVVERHEVLRTAFITVSGELRQQPRPAGPFDLPVRDLRHESDPDDIVRAEIQAEWLVLFDLAQPPLLRARLLRVRDQEHVLLVSMHHIVADGLSLNVLLPELHEFYAALCANRAAQLPPLSIQYKDFAVWQQEQLSSEAMQTHRAYWLEKLGGELPVMALPTDRPRPLLREFSGEHVLRRSPAATRTALHRFCQKQGVTLFMLLVATVKVLLHQITGQDDIVIGSPMAGNERGELQGQIGFYLNNVVLRDTVRRREPFTTLLQRVRHSVADALAHQDYPFDLLIRELAVAPAPGHSPLFDVQINLMPGKPPSLQLGDLVVASVGMDNQTTIFDLNFMFSDDPRGLAVEIDYSTALFDAARIERLGDDLLRLLTFIPEQPHATVRSLCGLLEAPSNSVDKSEFLAAALNLDEEF